MKRAWLLLLITALAAWAEPPPVVRDAQAPAVRELVDLASMDAGFRFDLRYATPDNFVHATLYPVAKAYLHRNTAKALGEVQHDLAAQGLGLKIFDAYRPLSVQQRMWDLVHDDRYVSNPAINAGRHTRGTAVDLTLVDRDGKELPMPTPFDDFTEKAHRDAPGIPADAARNSKLLETTMIKHGFLPYPFEWWHFDYRDWKKHPPLDVPLDKLP
ncbi:peptidase M15D vanX D-ala-D-ala dipeptidase [Chthoniobacter flavus Ellin428]|uniref:D-alanyl-D-alanine dipeptidase n=1 Tax=Chthoniobacter flavus Ellin428 TaxID=497964 RepID=B4D0H7_9BACT|nr:M15 family metallopeptidase [Chthoniobacter flavus]EDY19839.1 peptidase M15D vanX D-ala-D-ala dipeptidase [Chthoniobacter flavus Ellin428]TCO91887.1 D-alanyl-D-alanine dipeptidase [Chthoniobacter flavus]